MLDIDDVAYRVDRRHATMTDLHQAPPLALSGYHQLLHDFASGRAVRVPRSCGGRPQGRTQEQAGGTRAQRLLARQLEVAAILGDLL